MLIRTGFIIVVIKLEDPRHLFSNSFITRYQTMVTIQSCRFFIKFPVPICAYNTYLILLMSANKERVCYAFFNPGTP